MTGGKSPGISDRRADSTERLFRPVNLWETMNNDRERAANVLVVDDNPGDRRFIEEALGSSPLDLTVHTVNTRDEALGRVHQRTESGDRPKPDAILLDWNLSQATGEEVVTAAKSVDPSIPVLVMTGSKSEINDVKSTLSQADRHIEKPTEPEGYVEPLRSLLSGQ